MKKAFIGAIVALSCIVSAVPAAAQNRDRDRDGRSDRRGDWNRDRDGRSDRRGDWNRGRDGRPGPSARRDNRNDYRWNNYGGRYGYNGYRGKWRTGQRYSRWNDRRYYVNDYRSYNLPPPRNGYRYYREDNGDIVMAAIGTGIIGLILGSQLGR